ncbi:hypothetical protein GCM10025883_33890 [Mobilicoccus caccae]|uniref:Alpha/beta hydrolase family protein n=1 Tax=Mobilicoccus caccae TaxID=1859295 RepID=A0ABQ6IV27_9MICO|nr:hypothetical protein GCM10025883_33890 [Mobilicoccus caccae]
MALLSSALALSGLVVPAAQAPAAATPGSARTMPATTSGARPAVTAAVTPAAVATPGAPAAAPAARRAPLVWSQRTCSSDVRDLARDLPRPALVECTTMRVPLDHARPAKGSITLKVTRVRSSAPGRSTRTLFVNPGGPGVAADWMAPALAAHAPELHRSHVIVAVDPRGTGGSTPADCTLESAPVSEVRDPDAAELKALQASMATTVSRCVARHGRLLPHISTAATVADMEAVRARLGAGTVDWYGVSAGTWLGARYAQTHPRRVGRIVLDSVVDITTTWRGSFAEQPRGFQRRYTRQFAPWVARHHSVYGLGATPAAVLARIEAIRGQAVRGTLGAVTPADLDVVIADRLYHDASFMRMAEDLSVLAEGASDAELEQLRREAETAFDNGQGPLTAEDTVFMAVQCNDFAWSRSQSSYVEEGRRLGKAYPLIGWTWLTSPCATWPYRAKPLTPIRRHSLPAGLILQNELDPATPWRAPAGCGARRRTFGSSPWTTRARTESSSAATPARADRPRPTSPRASCPRATSSARDVRCRAKARSARWVAS